MNELQTILGMEIPITTRGILYLCKLKDDTLIVHRELLFDSASTALMYYAEIPNPESQLITGKTFDELIINLHKLHENIKDLKWIEELKGMI